METYEQERRLLPEERAVMQAFNEVFKQVGDISFEDMVLALEAVERRFANELAHTPKLVLEVQRRVAEEKVVMAKAYGRPVADAHALLAQAEALGWGNLEVRAEVLAVFARHCLDQGQRELGRRYLEPLLKDLGEEVERSGAEWAESHFEACRKLLEALGERDREK